jgi:hypothetical protein
MLGLPENFGHHPSLWIDSVKDVKAYVGALKEDETRHPWQVRTALMAMMLIRSYQVVTNMVHKVDFPHNMCSGWWFGTWFLFFNRLGIWSSQLTNSYFSEGFKPPTLFVLCINHCPTTKNEHSIYRNEAEMAQELGQLMFVNSPGFS